MAFGLFYISISIAKVLINVNFKKHIHIICIKFEIALFYFPESDAKNFLHRQKCQLVKSPHFSQDCTMYLHNMGIV